MGLLAVQAQAVARTCLMSSNVTGLDISASVGCFEKHDIEAERIAASSSTQDCSGWPRVDTFLFVGVFQFGFFCFVFLMGIPSGF